ncbi:MAG: leucine-rich repeat domain-containing protein [Clostridia bacterium]|nr:leucine-rich repeat domain-containing protein [Clostridia bacterium]
MHRAICENCDKEYGDYLHEFDKEKLGTKYKASKATCTQAATYYYSCTCGAKGTEVFRYGLPLEHNYIQTPNQEYLNSKATCTTRATYYESCLNCGTKGTETFEYGELLPHIFDKEITTVEYFAEEKTCKEKAKWHYSCVCGAKGTEVFGYAGLGTHDLENGTCTVCLKTESVGLKYEESEDKTYYIITGIGTCMDKELVIPLQYKGKAVKEIADNAFSGSDLTSVVIGDNITRIGTRAFYNCDSLSSIVIGKGVNEIPDRAFYGCDNLISIEIPDSVTSIGKFAFAFCDKLEMVFMWDGIQIINDFAFKYCGKLTQINIYQSTTYIGFRAFHNNSSLSNITYAGDKAAWANLEKETLWAENIATAQVNCLDGSAPLFN